LLTKIINILVDCIRYILFNTVQTDKKICNKNNKESQQKQDYNDLNIT